MSSSPSHKQTNLHILLVSLPAHGHLNPILTLGNSLVSKGLHVTLATTKTTLSSTGGVDLLFFSDGLPQDFNPMGNTDYYVDSVSKFGPVNLLALIRSHPSNFSCIIGTSFVPWVVNVAEEVGVPIAMLWIQPCTVYQIYHWHYNRVDEFGAGCDENGRVMVAGMPVFMADELPSFVKAEYRLSCFDRILKEVFGSLHKVKWVLGNSFMELEKEVIESVNNAGCEFWPVGPLVPGLLLGKEKGGRPGGHPNSHEQDGESECIDWLNKQKSCSVVYISFETLLSLSKKQIASISACLKHIKRPFLLVIRSPENQQLLELEDETKEQGLIVSWSPQAEVLSHPSIGCFLSHCGWNSLLESVAAGVPVVGCPQWSDQPTNAKLVTEVWGVGVKVKKDSEGGISGEEMGRCVEEVMSGEEFRKNALEWKRAAHVALAEGGSSDKKIDLFVKQLITHSLSN